FYSLAGTEDSGVLGFRAGPVIVFVDFFRPVAFQPVNPGGTRLRSQRVSHHYDDLALFRVGGQSWRRLAGDTLVDAAVACGRHVHPDGCASVVSLRDHTAASLCLRRCPGTRRGPRYSRVLRGLGTNFRHAVPGPNSRDGADGNGTGVRSW